MEKEKKIELTVCTYDNSDIGNSMRPVWLMIEYGDKKYYINGGSNVILNTNREMSFENNQYLKSLCTNLEEILSKISK